MCGLFLSTQSLWMSAICSPSWLAKNVCWVFDVWLRPYPFKNRSWCHYGLLPLFSLLQTRWLSTHAFSAASPKGTQQWAMGVSRSLSFQNQNRNPGMSSFVLLPKASTLCSMFSILASQICLGFSECLASSVCSSKPAFNEYMFFRRSPKS
jgi:hypothetical protein